MNKSIAFIVLCVFLTGCGSIINGTSQKIAITSDPLGAKVVAVGGKADVEMVTPCTMELKRKYDYMLTVSKEGYKPRTVQVMSVASAAVAGNLIAGGLIGWGVDAATGGDSRLVPEVVNVSLDPEIAAQSGPTVDKAVALEEGYRKIDEQLAAGVITVERASEMRKELSGIVN